MKPLIFQPSEKHAVLGQLYGSSLSLALAEYCQSVSGVLLLIAPDNLSANQLQVELEFFLKGDAQAPELLFFPDWETLPYDLFSPHQDIISERLRTLSRIQQVQRAVVITSVSTLMHRLCPVDYINHYAFRLKTGQKLDIHAFRNQLQHAGYYCVNKVLEHGEYAVRGSIVDVFPMGSQLPLRIELFDDEIEGLRTFDTETQRTIDKIDAIELLPAREFPLNEQSQMLFRRNFRELFSGNPGLCPIYNSISEGQYPSGIEYYLPLFYDKTASFFDYLPPSSEVVLIEAIHEQAEQFWKELSERYEQRRYDVSRPILAPEHCFIPPNAFLERANTFKPLRVYQQATSKKGAHLFTNIKPAPQLPIDRKQSEPLHLLKTYSQKPGRHLIVVESAGRREVLLDLLKPSGLKPQWIEHWADFLASSESICITTGTLLDGFELDDPALSVIVESQLFGQQATPQTRTVQKSIDPDLIIRDLAEIRIGDPVVHIEFGVGRYQGLKHIEANGVLSEFLILHYAGEDKIYVPVTALHRIRRYTGVDSEHAPLHKLGSDQWQKEKKKAQEKIHDVAIELLHLYAQREALPGHCYAIDDSEYQKFASGFPFTETQDQARAIEQIVQDMKSDRPMDRLICGDVGFGKTEVAMRAAFLAANSGKQVCVLVPTTLLAGQHFESFRNRFAEFPIRIELLSRFRSSKDTKTALEGLENGKVDIVIGTHKLFQSDIQFKNLGLLIIDEEHRFGVKQKEHIKALRTHVDILSMTATPIPRTLNMAMAGIRDISLIATPPAKRLSVKTFCLERNDSIIREALLREILRGGQVYFLHNNVQTIDKTAQELQALVPEAKVQIAHGQMKERELERVMSDFYHHRFNVLVCSTIIETGIDIPTANTILIDRADMFGLAQLHQLRGRVGRSHHQAYAYLLTPNPKTLTADATKRLEAIVSLEDLGAGFTLATHDLEIRGAGELLGEEQSGNMHAIGFSLYMELLDKAVQDLKSGKTPELSTPFRQGPEIELRISAIIPEDYIPDVHTRLIMYKRIANAKSQQSLHDLQIELIDRFGLLPDSVKHLILITELKLKAETAGITKITASGQQGKMEFSEKPDINPAVLIQLIQMDSKNYQMEGPQRLKFVVKSAAAQDRIFEIQSLVDKLKV